MLCCPSREASYSTGVGHICCTVAPILKLSSYEKIIAGKTKCRIHRRLPDAYQLKLRRISPISTQLNFTASSGGPKQNFSYMKNVFLTQQYRLFSNYSASLQMDICTVCYSDYTRIIEIFGIRQLLFLEIGM